MSTLTGTDAAGTPPTPNPYRPNGRSMRERMEAGEAYIALDPELGELSTRAQLPTERYNASSIADRAERRRILQELLGHAGEDIEIRPPFHVDYGRYISIGARTFANFGFTVLDIAPVRIGADCQFGPHVQLLTATHPLEAGPAGTSGRAAPPSPSRTTSGSAAG